MNGALLFPHRTHAEFRGYKTQFFPLVGKNAEIDPSSSEQIDPPKKVLKLRC
jgi:hypothetical protein